MNKDNIKAQILSLDKQIVLYPDNSSNYFERGKLYWKKGDKAKAMTDFNTAISLDPSSPAKSYLDMANEIMSFYNTDLYNP